VSRNQKRVDNPKYVNDGGRMVPPNMKKSTKVIVDDNETSMPFRDISYEKMETEYKETGDTSIRVLYWDRYEKDEIESAASMAELKAVKGGDFLSERYTMIADLYCFDKMIFIFVLIVVLYVIWVMWETLEKNNIHVDFKAPLGVKA
jgi:hypothetical protein